MARHFVKQAGPDLSNIDEEEEYEIKLEADRLFGEEVLGMVYRELQGKAKHTDKRAAPIITGTASPSQKVFHTRPHSAEKPVSRAYREIDTDLARDNLENDITAADLQDN